MYGKHLENWTNDKALLFPVINLLIANVFISV